MTRRLALLILAALLPGHLLIAGTPTLPTPPDHPALPLEQVRTDSTRFAATLQSYVNFCQTYAKAQYTVDCLSERFTFAAKALGNYGWERDAKATLRAAARDLDALAAKYASPTAPPVQLQATGANPIRATRPIRPVAPENIRRASAAALDVLETAELTLLRSATTSGDQAANALAFAQVAEVVGTAKVLLRAA